MPSLLYSCCALLDMYHKNCLNDNWSMFECENIKVGALVILLRAACM